MQLLAMRTENIYSYPKLQLGFIYSGGVTLILSKSLDQKTANGAGKTTILKILYFLIYGKDLNGVVKAAIPHYGSGGSYYGEIEFEENGHKYRIERFDKRKDLHPHKIAKECLNFYIDGKLFMGPEKGNEPESVQSVINSKIRMSPKLFVSSILSKQNADSNFLQANDTIKKDILAEVLDLGSYVKAFAAVKKEIDVVEARRQEKLNRAGSFREQIKNLQEQIKEQEELSGGFDLEKIAQISKEMIAINNEKSTVLRNKKNIIEVKDIASLKLSLAKTKGLITELEKELREEVVVTKTLTTKELEITQLKKDLIAEETKKAEIVKASSIQLSFEVDSSLSDNLFYKKYAKILLLSNKEELSKLQLEVSVITSEISEIENRLELLEDINKELNNISLDLNNLGHNIKAKETEINNLTGQKTELELAKDCPTCLRPFDSGHKKEHLQPKIDEFSKKISILVKEKESLLFLSKPLFDKKILLTTQVKDLEDLKPSLVDLKSLDKVASSILNKVEESVKLKENASSTIKELDITIKTVSENLQDAEFQLIGIKQIYDEFAPIKEKVESLKTEENILSQSIIENEKQELINNKSTELIKVAVERWKQLEKTVEALKSKANPYLELIKSIETKIKLITTQIKSFETSAAADDDELKYLKFWVIGFAATGIRSFISDDLIELLNRKVQEHLNVLFDGALGVLFESESENSKGISVNKIETKFFLNGREVYWDSLSGGQQRRCILATDLALTEVAESRSGTKLNVKFLDEPFNNIDTAGQMQAFRLFNTLAKEKDGFFVISHDENFQSMCANTIYILLQNGNSRIVDKTEFDSYSVNMDKDQDKNIFKDNKDQDFAAYLKELAKKKKDSKQETTK